jgi:hypothetical protein
MAGKNIKKDEFLKNNKEAMAALVEQFDKLSI